MDLASEGVQILVRQFVGEGGLGGSGRPPLGSLALPVGLDLGVDCPDPDLGLRGSLVPSDAQTSVLPTRGRSLWGTFFRIQ